MMKVIKLTLLFLLSFVIYCQGQDQYDVYYVSVGNAHYIEADRSSDEFGLYPIKGAAYSARFVAEFLEKGGSKYGILLESELGKYITKEDILDAIEKVTDNMDFDSDNERLLVFYYCGHGIGEAITGRQYIVPGNTVFDSASFRDHYLDLDIIEGDLIYSVDLLPELRQYSDQQLVMLDNCYEEPGEEKVLEHFTYRLGTMLNEFTTSLREIHQFRDPFNTVFYASLPGSTIRPVSPPQFLRTRAFPNLIGRIGRKFCLYASGVENNKYNADYHSFLSMMNNSGTDLLSSSLISYSSESYYNKKFLAMSDVQPQITSLKGSGTSKNLIEATGDLYGGPIHVLQATSGTITIESEQGDWIGGGGNHSITPADGEIMVMNQGDRLAIRFQELEEYEYFNFEFILPNKYTAKDNATTSTDNYWLDHEDVVVSTTGRSCSNSKGKLKVVSLIRDNRDRITNLNLQFNHRCDDSSSNLTGIIDLELSPVLN